MRCGRTPEGRDARRRGYRAAGRAEKGRLTLIALAPQIVTLVFPITSVTIWGTWSGGQRHVPSSATIQTRPCPDRWH